jgi:hypothetical protein
MIAGMTAAGINRGLPEPSAPAQGQTRADREYLQGCRDRSHFPNDRERAEHNRVYAELDAEIAQEHQERGRSRKQRPDRAFAFPSRRNATFLALIVFALTVISIPLVKPFSA